MNMMYRDEYVTHAEARRRDDILRRVKTVRGVRALMNSQSAGVFFATVFLVCTSVLVSVGDVIHNIMSQSELAGKFSYTYASLIHSRIIVQALALLMAISFFMIIARYLKRLSTPIYFVGNAITSLSPLKFFRS